MRNLLKTKCDFRSKLIDRTHFLGLTRASRRRPYSRRAAEARQQAPGSDPAGSEFLLISLDTVDLLRPIRLAISPTDVFCNFDF